MIQETKYEENIFFFQVLQENERTKLLKPPSTSEFDPSATEKRLRFRLNDNCSVGNISDNLEGLEGISEGAASTGNLSVTSSCDDLDKATNEIETDALFDNGSVSGRGNTNVPPFCYRFRYFQPHRISRVGIHLRHISVWTVAIDEQQAQIMLILTHRIA